MGIRLIGTIAAAAIVASACGGGDDQQAEVADMFIELAESGGRPLDRECVVEAAAGLSDSDAEKIVEAGTGGDPDVSPEADAVSEEMFDCVDVEAYRESFLAQFEGDDSLDLDCLRAALAGMATVDEIDAQVIDAAFGCAN